MTGARAETRSRAPAEVAARATEAVSRMGEMAADLRGCAILDRDGRGAVLAASGEEGRWQAAGAAFLAAADAAADRPAIHVHVATEDGEAFAVRHRGLAMVAVADRFTLASLIVFDMRMALREVAPEAGEGGKR